MASPHPYGPCAGSRRDHVDNTTCVLLKSQTFKDQIVTCSSIVHADLTGSLVSNWNINELVLFASRLEDIGVRCLAYLAFELLELVAAYVRMLFSTSLGLYPLLKAVIVNVLYSSTALAR
jgi:hypothetical protein